MLVCVAGLAIPSSSPTAQRQDFMLGGTWALLVAPSKRLLSFLRGTSAASLVTFEPPAQVFSCGRLLICMLLPCGALLEKQSYFFHPLTSDQWVKIIIFVFLRASCQRLSMVFRIRGLELCQPGVASASFANA